MEPPNSKKPARFYGLLLVAFLLLIGVLTWREATKMMGMSSASAASSSELQAAKPGDELKIVMEIQETDGKTTAKGKLLERKDETHYQRTSSQIAATFDLNTKLVMGTATDIRPGAIVHITGKWAKDNSVHADQIVILTGVVQVE